MKRSRMRSGIGVLVLCAALGLTQPVVRAEEQAEAGALIILSPRNGRSVTPGETLKVIVYPKGLSVTGVLVVAPNFAQPAVDDGGGVVAVKYRVPADAAGTIELLATAKTADGTIINSTAVQLIVAPAKQSAPR